MPPVRPSSEAFSIRPLAPDDVVLMEAMLTTFGEAFDEVDTYSGTRPRAAYLERLLGTGSMPRRL
jgi:aminoglycoside 3-N-acetyltransferase I